MNGMCDLCFAKEELKLYKGRSNIRHIVSKPFKADDSLEAMQIARKKLRVAQRFAPVV